MTTLTPAQRQFLALFLDALACAGAVEGVPAGNVKRAALRKYRRLHGQAVRHLEPGGLTPVLLIVGEQPGETWEERAGKALQRSPQRRGTL